MHIKKYFPTNFYGFSITKTDVFRLIGLMFQSGRLTFFTNKTFNIKIRKVINFIQVQCTCQVKTQKHTNNINTQ